MIHDREDLIRERAYAIWQAEGCPDGRRDQHWQQAVADLAQVGGEAAKQDAPVVVAEQGDQPSSPVAADQASVAPAKARTGGRVRKAAEAAPKGGRKKNA